MAADFASTWWEASPEVQRRITWTICSRVLIEKGAFTEVDVRREVRATTRAGDAHALLRLPRHAHVVYANAFAGAIVAYALSPIDLIPDFVPVLGYLDEVVLVPLGIALAIRRAPALVLAECRADLAWDGFRTNDANLLDPPARRIASDGQIRVTFIVTGRTVLGESDEDQRTMEKHATRPEVVPRSRGGRAIAPAIRIRSDRTLTEFVVP